MTPAPSSIPIPPLGYCTNVHPGPGLERSLSAILETGPEVRERVGGDGPLPIGLWLSAEAAQHLEAAGAAEEVRERLASQGLAVAGLNGFPYG
ncbi:MAG: metabolite traffic protein EboE, partial [Planctomycetota bacterium]